MLRKNPIKALIYSHDTPLGQGQLTSQKLHKTFLGARKFEDACIPKKNSKLIDQAIHSHRTATLDGMPLIQVFKSRMTSYLSLKSFNLRGKHSVTDEQLCKKLCFYPFMRSNSLGCPRQWDRCNEIIKQFYLAVKMKSCIQYHSLCGSLGWFWNEMLNWNFFSYSTHRSLHTAAPRSADLPGDFSIYTISYIMMDVASIWSSCLWEAYKSNNKMHH